MGSESPGGPREGAMTWCKELHKVGVRLGLVKKSLAIDTGKCYSYL